MIERLGRMTVPPVGMSIPPRHPDAPAPGSPIPIHWSQCACCSPTHPGGLGMRLYAGEGMSVHGEFRVTEMHQGAPGLAHGGLLSAALDESLGSLNWLVGGPAVTARLEIDFRRPVAVGRVVHIRAEVVGAAESKIFGRAVGRLDSDDGPVAISATALFIQVPADHFARHGRGVDIAAATLEREQRRTQRDFEVSP